MRRVLDFGLANAGGSPTFTVFKDLATLADIAAPAIAEIGSGTYYFDYDPDTGNSTVFKATLNGTELSDVIADAATTAAARMVLDFGSGSAGGSPTFLSYRDVVTLAAASQPTIVEIAQGLYYFDADFSTYTSLAYVADLSGITLSGVATYAAAASVAVPGGGMTLLDLRTAAKSEADMDVDPHVSDAEWDRYINGSRLELYDILVTRFGEDYAISKASMTTDGNDYLELPDGVLYNGADPFYKCVLVEALTGSGVITPVTLLPFNLREKNRYNFPLYVTTAGFMLPRYRIVGSRMHFTPRPATGIVVQMWYAPKLAPLVNDTDVAEDWSGWLEYVVVDAAIKALGKQERDASLLMARKMALKERIEAVAQNRNVGEPATVAETNADAIFGFPGVPGAFGGMGY